MSKEKDMLQPNSLGHFHRDIRSAKKVDQYYMGLTLSCGHITRMTRQAYAKYKDHATLCTACKPKSRGALFINVPIPTMVCQPNGNSISTLRTLKMAHEVILQSTINNDQILEDKKIIALNDLQVMIENVES